MQKTTCVGVQSYLQMAVTGNWCHELQAYELSEREWTIVSQLVDILKVRACHHSGDALSLPHAQVVKDTTQYLSRMMPNLVTVIPAMDYINDCFSAQANNLSLSHYQSISWPRQNTLELVLLPHGLI